MPRQLLRATACALFAVPLALASGASAAPVRETPSLPKTCPGSGAHHATITAGSVTKFEALHPDVPTAIAEGTVLGKGAKLYRGRTARTILRDAYAVTGDVPVSLDFRGNDYRVDPGTFFYVTCYRKSARGAALPMLSIRAVDKRAKATVLTATKNGGGLSAGFPGFGGPNRPVRQTIELAVEFDGEPSATWTSNKTLTVTPQVGKGAGTCIYPRKVRIQYGGKVSILKR